MTYNAIETSVHGGQPVELFLFEHGLQRWAYTNALNPITYLSSQYVPTPIERSKLSSSGSFDKQEMEVTVPRDLEIGSIWKVSSPSDVVSLKIFRHHLTDTDSDFRSLWVGRVVDVNWSETELEIKGESIMTSIGRNGLSRRYGYPCPYALYGPGCTLATVAFEVSTVANSVNGNTLGVNVATGYDDDHFSGGFVSWQNNETFTTERRFIVSHTGSTLVLDSVVVGLTPGTQELKIHPGCNKEWVTCRDKFDNLLNYGGFPDTPKKNPFDGGGTPIF